MNKDNIHILTGFLAGIFIMILLYIIIVGVQEGFRISDVIHKCNNDNPCLKNKCYTDNILNVNVEGKLNCVEYMLQESSLDKWKYVSIEK